uniref:Uncharacterized protein n=1 Tax=Cacopsylla melanoneura TaxID=428564 RepID=A0A8D8W9K1_9HEMI
MPFKILWPLDFLVCSSPSYPRCRVSICFFFSVPSRLFFSIIFLVSSVLLLFFVFFIILCFYFHFIFHFISLSSVLFMIFNFVFPPRPSFCSPRPLPVSVPHRSNHNRSRLPSRRRQRTVRPPALFCLLHIPRSSHHRLLLPLLLLRRPRRPSSVVPRP